VLIFKQKSTWQRTSAEINGGKWRGGRIWEAFSSRKRGAGPTSNPKPEAPRQASKNRVSKKALFSRIKWFCNAHPELFKPARPNAPLEKSLFSRGESLCNARLGKFGGNKSARRIFRSDFSREISFFSQPEIVQAQPSKMPPMKKPYFREENRFATLVWEGLGAKNPPGESYEAIFLEKIRLFSQPEIIQAQPSEMPFRKKLIFPRKIVLQRSPGKIRW
jgi:hypothetical protein